MAHDHGVRLIGIDKALSELRQLAVWGRDQPRLVGHAGDRAIIASGGRHPCCPLRMVEAAIETQP